MPAQTASGLVLCSVPSTSLRGNHFNKSGLWDSCPRVKPKADARCRQGNAAAGGHAHTRPQASLRLLQTSRRGRGGVLWPEKGASASSRKRKLAAVTTSNPCSYNRLGFRDVCPCPHVQPGSPACGGRPPAVPLPGTPSLSTSSAVPGPGLHTASPRASPGAATSGALLLFSG